jgi:hypothetical protein
MRKKLDWYFNLGNFWCIAFHSLEYDLFLHNYINDGSKWNSILETLVRIAKISKEESDTTCDKVCQWLTTGWWVFFGYSGFLHLSVLLPNGFWFLLWVMCYGLWWLTPLSVISLRSVLSVEETGIPEENPPTIFVENRSISLVPAGVDFQWFHCSMLL